MASWEDEIFAGVFVEPCLHK